MNKEKFIICTGAGLVGIGIAHLIQHYRIKKLKEELKDNLKNTEYVTAYLNTILDFDNKFYKGEA